MSLGVCLAIISLVTWYKHRHHLHHLLATARRNTYDAAASSIVAHLSLPYAEGHSVAFLICYTLFLADFFCFSIYDTVPVSGPVAPMVPASKQYLAISTGTLRFRLLDCFEKTWEVLVSEARCLQRHFTSASQNSVILSLVSVCARAANEPPAKFTQSRRRPLLGPFPGCNYLLVFSHLWIRC